MVSSQDIGTLAAQLLLQANPPSVVELRGHSLTPQEVGQALGQILGRDVQSVENPRTDWEAQLQAAGMSAVSASLLAELHDAINAGRLLLEHPDQAHQANIPWRQVLSQWTTVSV